jgi:Kdo2-lipid IVA lauroyltransferase/acyltransferase
MDSEKDRTQTKNLTPGKNAKSPGSWLLYWLVIKPISVLPYFILYRVSDLFFLVLWYVIPYRKKVVLGNLARVFPEKSESERRTIARKFYRHFADLVIESLKNFSISRENANERMVQHNTELLNKYAAQGRSIVICGGHCGNWELWAMAAPLRLNHILLGIYKRLSNPYFDQKMRESRSRYGIVLVPTIETGNYLRTHPDEVNALIIAIDQSPANPHKALWIDWFGQDTAVYFGAEKYATDFDRPIVFGSIRKVKRGYYEVTYHLVTDTPKALPKEFITRKLFDILEADIRRDPELWLWTHKRWKHKRPAVITPGESASA